MSVVDSFLADPEATFVELLMAAEADVEAVPVLRELVAASDAVAELMCDNDSLAIRFDAVVTSFQQNVEAVIA